MKKSISKVFGTPEEVEKWIKYYDPNTVFREINARLDERP